MAEILIGAPHQADGLTACALAYLALPNLIFLFGWFRTSIALLLGAGMLLYPCSRFSPGQSMLSVQAVPDPPCS
ncbi:MAG: hypothetical protein IPK02_17580 [Candidatus Accumulibacter sp.]|uniref:Uncharacterized protein n=1 Tax=Candidatus Accumulibacter affinis TaxID=2954384 RepID=A0A935TDA1_9PROT|nr:hypothetical protein [Candidatus Accumulibacter affinis]